MNIVLEKVTVLLHQVLILNERAANGFTTVRHPKCLARGTKYAFGSLNQHSVS